MKDQSRIRELPSGAGWIEITLHVDIFSLDKQSRQFVFELIDKFTQVKISGEPS
jgi:hypothetical protein